VFLHGYHLTADLVDDALRWVHTHDAVAPTRPFFLYFATGATHAPHQVPRDWITRFRGQFDQGWDVLREQTFARQKALGVIPPTAELTPRPAELPAWASLSADQKRLYARQMEVYAAFLSQTDDQVGRLLRGLNGAGTGNTLVLYLVGDNGGSAEGGLEGSDTATASTDGQPPDLARQLAHIDDLGGPYFDNHYAAAWSWATSTPFQWMKQIASHFGGTRDGLVISWPGHTARENTVRTQFAHVNDIAPTIYAATGIQFPATVNGVPQIPLEGRSLLATFTNPAAQTGHTEQYFEIFGNRAIYQDGWVAAARRYAPWEIYQNPAKIFLKDFAADRWELYHVATDFSEAHDLATTDPTRLALLKTEFDREAKRNNVYPLAPIPIFGAPSPRTGRTHFTYTPDLVRIPPDMVPDLTGAAHRLTAEITVPPHGADGVIVAEGGRFGGFSLYVQHHHIVYENNILGTAHERIVSAAPLPTGHVTIVFTFTPVDQLARVLAAARRQPPGGDGVLTVNGHGVGAQHFSQFGDFTDAINETLDVGRDTGSPVSRDYASPFPFQGTVYIVTIDVLP
jgi:arylsulfatase